jgi:hypothetical protein
MADSSSSENESESELSEDSASEDDENVAFGPLEKAAQAGEDLRIPRKAHISRKRKIETNLGNQKRGSKDPKLVSAWDRVYIYSEGA